MSEPDLVIPLDHGTLGLTVCKHTVQGDGYYFLFDLKQKGEPTSIDTYFGLSPAQALEVYEKIKELL